MCHVHLREVLIHKVKSSEIYLSDSLVFYNHLNPAILQVVRIRMGLNFISKEMYKTVR
jgi:hypothetical protein